MDTQQMAALIGFVYRNHGEGTPGDVIGEYGRKLYNLAKKCGYVSVDLEAGKRHVYMTYAGRDFMDAQIAGGPSPSPG